MDELKAYIKILTSEVETLRKKIRELRNETKASKQRISQLQGETNNLRFQREELSNHFNMIVCLDLMPNKKMFSKTPAS